MEELQVCTNEDAIRKLWTKRQIAEALIKFRSDEDWDYDWDDNPYVCGYIDTFVASDGKEFPEYESAFEHEMWWLSQEVCDE